MCFLEWISIIPAFNAKNCFSIALVMYGKVYVMLYCIITDSELCCRCYVEKTIFQLIGL